MHLCYWTILNNGGNMSKAQAGNKVKVHYTGKLDNGDIFDSSVGREPLEFQIGGGQVIKGFDDGVTGMEIGEKKTIRIEAENAYGPVREDLVLTAERSQIPPEINIELGIQLQIPQPEGMPIVVTVTEITDEHVILDANHKLAGKALTFELELVEIA